MKLFYGARSAKDLYYADAFAKQGAELVLTTEDGSRGEKGRITGPLTRALDEIQPGADVTIYACGPTPMMRAVAVLAARSNRPMFASLEPVMGCGMGGCYSCVVRVKRGAGSHFVRSCIEGPVFDGTTVLWDTLGEGH
jgi:dihydroorotate dehydrogenase electron transfer subunit